jgi:hypothetical protein
MNYEFHRMRRSAGILLAFLMNQLRGKCRAVLCDGH